MERFQAPSFCPGCGKPQSSWLPFCRSCGTRFADSCPVCRRAIPVGAGTCADHIGAAVPPPAPAGGATGPIPPGLVPPPPGAPVGSGRRALQVMVGVVAALVASAGIGAVLIGTSNAEDRVRNYVSGTGDKEFFASDLQFRALFPTVPSRSTQAVPGTDAEMVMYTSDLGDVGFGAGGIDMPHGRAFDLNLAVNGVAAGLGGHVESSQLTTFAGFPAAEYVVALPQGLYDKGLLVRATDRVYQLQAVGKTSPPAGYDHFKESFHLAQP